MKKIYLIALLLTAYSAAWATFTPVGGKLYNIVQTVSGLTIGAVETSPVLETINQHTDQAFRFEAVSGKTDTYYLINEDGQYLSRKTSDSWDYWSVIYATAPVDANNSEWVVEGEEASFRLMLVNNSKYLASDAIANGSPLYCDKAADNERGTYTVQEAQVIREVFEVSDKGFGIEVEKDVQPYWITIRCQGIEDDIHPILPNGFTMTKTVFSKADFINGGGKLTVGVNTSAAVGTKGFIYFAIGEGDQEFIFDTIAVSSVEKAKRYYIKNNSADGLIIGKHTTINAPALTLNIGAPTQKYLIKPVHPGINDSLYVIVQDSSYQMMVKDYGSGWDVIFDHFNPEAIWKLYPQANGTLAIYNSVTGKALGTDGVSVDSRLYDDKTFTAAPTAKPYCEWVLVDAGSVDVFGAVRIAEKAQPLGVEKGFQSVPVNITTVGVKETITIVPSEGFTIDKNSFTPEEMTALNGALKIRVSTAAKEGTTGTLYFKRQAVTTPFDTVNLVSVPVLPRYFISNTSSSGLVIGNDSTNKVPALTELKQEATQKFILRPVTDGADSLYYIIQDGDYRFIVKEKSNYWGTTFGVASNEAKWKLDRQSNGTLAIYNNVTQKALGTDGIIFNSYLYVDKAFTAAPTTAPYCEWLLINMDGSAVKGVKNTSQSVEWNRTSGGIQLNGTSEGDAINVFDLSGRLVLNRKANSGSTALSLTKGFYLVRVKNQTIKVIL